MPVLVFCISIIVGFILSIIVSYKKEKPSILIIYVLMTLNNFDFVFIQLKEILYRTCSSWGFYVAIVCMATYMMFEKKNNIRNIIIVFIAFLLMYQTKDLNQWFYNDYVRYQKDLTIAHELIYDLEKSYDTSKPLVIMGTPYKGIGGKGAQSNSLSVLWWGKKAFNDNGAEFIKFLNSLGYDFKRPNDEQYEKGKIEAETMNTYPKDGSIKELEDCIVINF